MYMKMSTRGFVLALLVAVLCLGEAFSATPSEYLEYIESDGQSQYVDLGVEGRCRIEIEAEIEYSALPSDGGFIGSRVDGGNTRLYALHHYMGALQLGYGTLRSSGCIGMPGIKYVVNARFMPGEQSLAINGSTLVSSSSSEELDTGLNLFLFAVNKGGQPDYYTAGRLYWLKIWNLDADGRRASLAADFRPCLDGDGVPCLYDGVSDDFRFNAGGGTFSYARLPAEDAPTVARYVTYLESDGTQYVDTDVVAGTGLGVDLKMSFVTVPSDGGILAAVNSSGHRFYAAYYFPGNGGFYNASGSVNLPPSSHLAEAGVEYTIHSELYRDNRDLKINYEDIGPNYTSDNTHAIRETLHVFGLNYAGESKYRSAMRLYSCQIWVSPLTRRKTDELVLLRDFHPCVDTDGVAGLHDSVSGRIFYNGREGGNAFVPGETIVPASRVVASNMEEFEGSASPAYGEDSTVQQGSETTYTCSKYAVNAAGVLFRSQGYTTATSEDGVLWSGESALVESRVATLVYPGSWWRLTWNWQRVGVTVSVEKPDGASVTHDADTGDFSPGIYPADSFLTLTASATDGNGGVFAGWSGDVPAGVFDTNRSVRVSTTASRSLAVRYRHAWTLVSESGGTNTISDGVWSVDVADGVVADISGGAGPLDFSGVEGNLGFRITGFKSWASDAGHVGPPLVTEVIAPDVVEVGAFSFSGCRHLVRAVFSPSLVHIGCRAFYDCGALRELSPSLSRYLSQAQTSADDTYVFAMCSNLVEDLVVERGGSPLRLSDSYFQQTGLLSVDFSHCRGGVNLTTSDDVKSVFRRSPAITSMTLPPKVATIPRGLCWGLASLTNLFFAGVLPPSENIGMFYSYEFYRLRVYISRQLNPNVVSDLKLREPTEEEKAKASFPRDEYESGRLLGVWHEATSGWGKLDWGGNFCPMWVIDWRPGFLGTGLFLTVR